MNYGKGVQRARVRAGLSKRQLAGRAQLHPSYITHIETARKRPSLDVLEAICAGIGVTMPVLMLMSAEDADLVDIAHDDAGELGDLLAGLLEKVSAT